MFQNFTVIPAIDLKAGRVVRLTRGEMASAKVYGDDPARIAQGFENAGATTLHVVDLDGAIAGEPRNLAALRKIRTAIGCTIEASGGLRTMNSIGEVIDAGADRVSIGSAALLNPELLEAACRAFPGRVQGSIDVRDGRPAIKGWVQTSEISLDEVATRFREAGVAAVAYTDIARDGMRSGIDAAGVAEFARRIRLPVIASGGIATIADITALSSQFSAGVVGAIVGRALYEGDLSLEQIFAELRNSDS